MVPVMLSSSALHLTSPHDRLMADEIVVTSTKGLSLSEDKGVIVVKKVDSKSALGMDGRIRVGDQLLAINRKPVDGMTLNKVK